MQHFDCKMGELLNLKFLLDSESPGAVIFHLCLLIFLCRGFIDYFVYIEHPMLAKLLILWLDIELTRTYNFNESKTDL